MGHMNINVMIIGLRNPHFCFSVDVHRQCHVPDSFFFFFIKKEKKSLCWNEKKEVQNRSWIKVKGDRATTSESTAAVRLNEYRMSITFLERSGMSAPDYQREYRRYSIDIHVLYANVHVRRGKNRTDQDDVVDS